MVKLKRFGKIAGKSIATSDGSIIGKIEDFAIDESTGNVREIRAQPGPGRIENLKKDENGRYIIPYAVVKPGTDFLVVDADKLRRLK